MPTSPSNRDAPFARNLRAAMDRSGVSTQELGDEVGVSRQLVSGWRNGQASPYVAQLPAIADVVRSTPEELVADPDAGGRELAALKREVEELRHLVRQLPPDTSPDAPE